MDLYYKYYYRVCYGYESICLHLLDLNSLMRTTTSSFPLLHPALKSSVPLGKNIYSHTWFLTVREERRLTVFKNRNLRRVFGPKMDENGECTRLYNEEIHSLYHPLIRLFKFKILSWTRDLGMQNGRQQKCFENIIMQTYRKEASRCRWEDNIWILLNMFHAQMGRFKLELIYYFTYFFTVVPSNNCVFLSCRPFVVNTTFSNRFCGCWNFFCLLVWALDSLSLNHWLL